MSSILIPRPPTLPEDYCPESWQQVFDDIANDFDWTINGTPGISIGESPPSDQTILWIRTIDGFPDSPFIYVGEVGMWIWPLLPKPDSRKIYMWNGMESDLWSLDGGDGVDPSAVAPTLVTGSFYEVFSSLAGKVPVGVGTLMPSGSPVALGGTGGEDEHTLTVAELPEHSHPVETGPTTSGDDGGVAVTSGPAPAFPTIVFPDAFTGGGDPHSTMPPYYGLYFYKHTARKYLTAL